ncbi:MAG: SIMPL domain-containing protein [Bacteriovoracaceae bacterium]|nr:SIMPL domain-containing protein [Bacteriovoracaceae bacterium]
MNLSANAEVIRTISVTGSAEKTFQPDIVRINLIVWSKGFTAKEAQKNNQLRFESLKNALSNFKIKKEDIKTLSYELNPDYVYNPKTNLNSIQGYNCQQSLSITLRSIENAGPFLDELSVGPKKDLSGVNVNTLQFDLDKRLEEEKSLLGQAVRAAEAQAAVLASAASVKLKGVYRLVPRGAQVIQPMYAEAMMDMNSRAQGKSLALGTQLMSGEVKVSADVSVDYLIE